MPEAVQIACVGGVFVLPDEVYAALKRAASSGMVYLRQSEDSLLISPTPVGGGRRRQLQRQYRAAIFQTATRLAAIRMGESLLLMAAHWKQKRNRGGEPLKEEP
jgi:hypothetical protein